MKVGDREYCLAQRLVIKLGERQNLQKIAASTLRSALTTVADLERQLKEAWAKSDKLLELVADLVAQGCTTRGTTLREGDKSVLHHSFISTYEEAFDVLEDAGLLKDIGREEYQWQSRAAEEG